MSQLLDGRYQILEVLESTELGSAYLAQDTRRPGESLCFVKHLHLITADLQFIEIARYRFQQEAEILEKLSQHDQIPNLLAYFEEYQDFYMVESYIEGQSLVNEILPGHPWSEEQVISLLWEVLEILSFIHEQGVIHRDIKPGNLMRRQSDNKLVLLDFGAIKEINHNGHPNPPTARIGTIEYMPVEQFEGHPQCNSDIYALGMIGIQALTGLPVYDLGQLREKNPNNQQKVVWRHLAIVEPEFADVLDKMVCHNYQERYLSAAAVLADLKTIRHHAQPLSERQKAYREEVKRCTNNRGNISVVGRKILEELRFNLDLSSDEVEAIEDEILNPYRKYQEKGERYEQALLAAINQHYPLTSETWEELKRLQQVLGINDDDVAYIESQILPKSLGYRLLGWTGLFSNQVIKPPRSVTQTAKIPNLLSGFAYPFILVAVGIITLLGAIWSGSQYLEWREAKQRKKQWEAQEIQRVTTFFKQKKYDVCLQESAKLLDNSSQSIAIQTLLQNCQDALNWRMATFQELGQHLGAVGAIAFSPDGKTLASGSRDQTIKLWDLTTQNLITTMAGDGSAIWSVNFSPNSTDLAAGSYYWRILEWNVETGEAYIPLQHQGAVWSVEISPDEQRIASGSSDGTVKVWDRKTGFILYDFLEHEDIVYTVAWNPTGNLLASGSKDKTIKVMDLQTGEIKHSLEGHLDQVRSIAISSDNQVIVSGSYDDTVKIWDLETGQLLQTLEGHLGDVLSVVISPDGQTIASGSKDRTIKLWDRKTGELLSTLTGHTNEIYTVSFSPDGQIIASGGKDRTIKLWRR